MSAAASNPASKVVHRVAGRLKFPQLFALAAALFVLDLLIPDLIPFIDEILLGLATVLLGTWRDKSAPAPQPPGEKPPMKDVTPKQ